MRRRVRVWQWHPSIPVQDRRTQLAGGPEATRYEKIAHGTEPLEAMSERALSDGSTRMIRGD